MADDAGGPMNEEARAPGRGPAILAACSILVLVLDGIGMLFLGLALAFHVPHYEQIFMDMGVALPAFTRFILTVPPAAPGALLGLLVLGLIFKEFLVRSPGARLGINLTAGAFAVFVFFVYWIALYLPFVKMTEQLSGA